MGTVGPRVGIALHEALERAARDAGMSRLHASVSEAAGAFFLRRGWVPVESRTIERHGVELVNHSMEKSLSHAHA